MNSPSINELIGRLQINYWNILEGILRNFGSLYNYIQKQTLS